MEHDYGVFIAGLEYDVVEGLLIHCGCVEGGDVVDLFLLLVVLLVF